MNNKHTEWCWAWFLIAPTIIGLVALNILPIFQTLFMSLFKTGNFGRGNIFIGLSNYRDLLSDRQALQAVLNTLSYTALVVPATLILSMILAVVLDSDIKGRSLYRTIFFIPMIAPPAAVTMVWRWIYNPQYGLLNRILGALDIAPQNWITGSGMILISVSIIGIWTTAGYNMILILAGLQEIPKDFFEAAEIDGAKPLYRFVRITLPLVSPTLFFVTITSLISAMQVFDVIFMMVDYTNPARESIQSLVYLFYNYSFITGNKGYGSTIVLLLLTIILLLTFSQNRLQKKWVTYQ